MARPPNDSEGTRRAGTPAAKRRRASDRPTADRLADRATRDRATVERAAVDAAGAPARRRDRRPGASTAVAATADLPSALAGWRPKPGSLGDQLLVLLGVAAELGLGRMLGTPAPRPVALERAGALLRDARRAAGLTRAQLSAAVDLGDPSLLDRAERGRAALPVEVLLRLSAVLARNDPVPFVMQLVRDYGPQLWRGLEPLGIARLAERAGRERAFVDIYRSRDAARALSDAEFEQVRAFTDAAFAMALKLVDDARHGPRPRGDPPLAGDPPPR